jgi:GNAT superfamily N-acetyltransferase
MRGAPSNVSIRRATPRDAPTLASLRLALRQEGGPLRERPEAFLERCEAWMVKHLGPEGSAWSCWVALEQDSLVGQIWLLVFEKIPNPNDTSALHAYITNFFVRPGSRKSGIGARLLAAALDSLKDCPVASCVLWATEGSRSLYARHGFAVPPAVMELEMGGASRGGPGPDR